MAAAGHRAYPWPASPGTRRGWLCVAPVACTPSIPSMEYLLNWIIITHLWTRGRSPVKLRTTSSPRWEICHWSNSTGLFWPLTLGATCTDWTAGLSFLRSGLQVNEDIRKQRQNGTILTWMRRLLIKEIISQINSKTTDVYHVQLCSMGVSQWTTAVFLQLDTAARCTTSAVVPISTLWKLLLPSWNELGTPAAVKQELSEKIRSCLNPQYFLWKKLKAK